MKALVNTALGLVIQRCDRTFDIAPGLEFIDIPNGEQVDNGWSYNSAAGTFSPPIAPTTKTAAELAEAQAANNPFARALVKFLAEKHLMSVQQVIDALKAKA